MNIQKIEDYIHNELSIDDKKIALDFVQFLKDNELIFVNITKLKNKEKVNGR